MRYIYSLSDPNTKEIRYIGQTNNINKRLRGHINSSVNIKNKQYNTHKCSWIRKLLQNGYNPISSIIETVNTLEESNIREIYYIDKFTNEGVKLTNSHGGDVTDFSAETKEKMSLAKKGKKLEEIVGDEKAKELKNYYSNRITKNNPNKSNNPLVREKISNTLKDYFKDKNNHWAYGKKMSEDMCDNLRQSHLNNPKNVGNRNKRTEEEKDKIRNKILGTKIQRCKIIQNDLEGNFIKKWNSIREICRETNYNRSTLNKCINNGRSYAGFNWVKELLF